MPVFAIRSVYQPIVDLVDGHQVALEALVRGRPGPLETPRQLFAAAALDGTSDQLDEACLESALRGADRSDHPGTVFVNVEPTTIAKLPTGRLAELAALVGPEVQVVLEITERDLLEDPAELVRSLDRVRELGWGVALDDVGAEPAGLAMLPFLRPDVIKLDLALIRGRTTRQAASVVNAVRAEAERSGSVVVAEGIEHEGHVERALAVGASLGQGWLLGRPGLASRRSTRPLRIRPVPQRQAQPGPRAQTPYALLSSRHPVKRASAPLLSAMTRQLEHQALLLDEHTVVLAGFQHASLMTEQTRRRFASLAAVTALTAVVGPQMPEEPAPGVPGTVLATDDPLGEEWVIAVVSPHFAAVLAAQEVGAVPAGGEGVTYRPDTGLRRLDYVLTYDRPHVLEAAALLLQRIRPRPVRRRWPVATGSTGDGIAPTVDGPRALSDLLLRAISTATNGIVVADARLPDQPLVYVNEAFSRLCGYEADEVLGRNCRLLQGAGTDRSETMRLRREVAAGRAGSAVLLNYRKDGTPFWNEVRLSPVLDDHGVLTHYIGNQLDVSARVEEARRTAYLARHDAMTGLVNRSGVLTHLDTQLRRARRDRTEVAVLMLDLDGFKSVNDRFGHAAGDQVLTLAARRLSGALGDGALVGRLGGDEFLVVLGGLPPGGQDGEPDRPSGTALAAAAGTDLQRALAPPFEVGGTQVRLRASVGAGVFPRDAEHAVDLLAFADAAMYLDKVAPA